MKEHAQKYFQMIQAILMLESIREKYELESIRKKFHGTMKFLNSSKCFWRKSVKENFLSQPVSLN